MIECKLYAVIHDWTNVEFVVADSEIEAAQSVLKVGQLDKLSVKEVEEGIRNIEALCHEFSFESAITFNYSQPDTDLITRALSYDKTTCYGVSKSNLH